MDQEIVTIDRLDRLLIQALQLDGRVPFARVGGLLGVSEQTVARRYRKLRTARFGDRTGRGAGPAS